MPPSRLTRLIAILVVPVSGVVHAADNSSVPVGFGQPTGGAGGTTVTVTDAGQLSKALRSPEPLIIQVEGQFDSLYPRVFSNKTIRGIGKKPTLIGGLYLDQRATNVIIQDLTITTTHDVPGAGGPDGITIAGGTNVWIDHCTFFDCADGSLDIKKGADNVTVSWCKFYYTYDHGHNLVNLIGSSDKDGSVDRRFHITFHHNWWGPFCKERMPSNRFGLIHLFNNYYSCAGNNYCARGRLHSEMLIENNSYDGVKLPWEYMVTEGATAPLIKASGNAFIDTAEPAGGKDDVFKPSYAYTLDEAGGVKASVMAGAGSRL
jgi:pectate lyase